MKKNHVTHAFLTTQVGRQFATDIENHSLKYSTVGREKFVMLNPPKNFSLVNGYGTTECIILITDFKVDKSEKNILIGKLIDNVKIYIVDQNFNRVPIGVVGELIVAGIHVGADYLNRPEKTAERFINCNGMRVYKSSDYARGLQTAMLKFREGWIIKLNCAALVKHF